LEILSRMTVKELEALDINAQASLVWDGEFVGSRVVDDVFIQRYRLTSFDVDVYYDPMDNKIVKIKALMPLAVTLKG
jgi:hypothetical protein